MYILKSIPEDFIVEEKIARPVLHEGNYLLCSLKKKNMNTEDALQHIARKLHVPRKHLSYAGLKDKHAITKQYITIKKGHSGIQEKLKKLLFEDIEIALLGYTDEPLSLGDHVGNSFIITIRGLHQEEMPKHITMMINFFGEQRFSQHNAEIGTCILKKKFKEAVMLIQQSNNPSSNLIQEHLQQYPNQYVNALLLIPKKILLLYVHSIQSLLWNQTAVKLVAQGQKKPMMVPLIGFASELVGDVQRIVEELLPVYGLSKKDFLVREIPWLSLEGSERALYTNIQQLSMGELSKDELHEGLYKVTVSFFLEKGSYATEAITQMMEK